MMITRGLTITSKYIPKKPSKLLEDAINDASNLLGQKGYELNMMEWMTEEDGVCTVCLAGAWLVHRSEWDSNFARVDIVDADSKLDKAMVAIDAFRRGQIWRALRNLGIERPGAMPTGIAVYSGLPDENGKVDWPLFFKDMRRVVKLLKDHNL